MLVAMSHSLTLPLSVPTARVFPSGERRHGTNAPLMPSKGGLGAAVLRGQNSDQQEGKIEQSGLFHLRLSFGWRLTVARLFRTVGLGTLVLEPVHTAASGTARRPAASSCLAPLNIIV